MALIKLASEDNDRDEDIENCKYKKSIYRLMTLFTKTKTLGAI